MYPRVHIAQYGRTKNRILWNVTSVSLLSVFSSAVLEIKKIVQFNLIDALNQNGIMKPQ